MPKQSQHRSGKERPSARSCEVPGITVSMGEHQISDFEGVGSAAGARDFAVNLVSCSAGISKVTYMLDGADGNYFPGAGVIKLGAKSVSGVGGQI